MNKLTEQQASPVFGLRYLEDREVEGLDVVGCLISRGDGTATGATTTTRSSSRSRSVPPARRRHPPPPPRR